MRTTSPTMPARPPPPEAVRLLVARMAMKKTHRGKPLALRFSDATKTYFNAKPTRDILIRAPKELGLPPNTVGQLLRCAYGTRDAGALWEEHYAQVLLGMGFKRGRAGPTCIYRPQWEIAVVVHSDDFVALGTDDMLSLYEAGLREAFELGECVRLGLEKHHVQEHRILNRILRASDAGLHWEADPGHVELLTNSLSLEGCRYVGTTGKKSQDFDDIDNENESTDQNDDIANHDNNLDTNTNTVASIVDKKKENKRIIISDKKKNIGHIQRLQFHPDVQTIDIDTPYAIIYGFHPSTGVSTGHIGDLTIKQVPPDSDPFTGKSVLEMQNKMQGEKLDHSFRGEILRAVLCDGPAWELSPRQRKRLCTKRKSAPTLANRLRPNMLLAEVYQKNNRHIFESLQQDPIIFQWINQTLLLRARSCVAHSHDQRQLMYKPYITRGVIYGPTLAWFTIFHGATKQTRST